MQPLSRSSPSPELPESVSRSTTPYSGEEEFVLEVQVPDLNSSSDFPEIYPGSSKPVNYVWSSIFPCNIAPGGSPGYSEHVAEQTPPRDIRPISTEDQIPYLSPPKDYGVNKSYRNMPDLTYD